MRRKLISAACMFAFATPTAAQDSPGDWEMIEDSSTNFIAATAAFSSGITIGLRCVNEQYDVIIGGLPEAPAGMEERPLSIQFGDNEPYTQNWFVSTNRTAAVSGLPARLARRLREGGIMRIRVQEPGEGGRRLRYDLNLPASATNIDRTLESCGRPTEDPRDALVQNADGTDLPLDFVWARAPELHYYPQERTYERGAVVLSCLTEATGRLSDCVAESEYPRGGGFAEEAIRAARRSRLQLANNPEAPVPSRIVVFAMRFRMEGAADAAIRRSSMIPRDPDR